MSLGQDIIKARVDRRMQQQALAQLTGIGVRYLSHIEHDLVDPRWSQVLRIAQALGMSLDCYVARDERHEAQ